MDSQKERDKQDVVCKRLTGSSIHCRRSCRSASIPVERTILCQNVVNYSNGIQSFIDSRRVSYINTWNNFSLSSILLWILHQFKMISQDTGKRYIYLKLILVSILVFLPLGSTQLLKFDIIERNKSLCLNDTTKCRMPQSKDEKIWGKHCFDCTQGLAVCVTDIQTQSMYYICVTADQMICIPGYHGTFTYTQDKISFERVACPAGTYNNVKQDCRMPCLHHPHIDLNEYTVLRPPSSTGDPALVECNRKKNLCPTKLGFIFDFTKKLHYEDVCAQIGSGACLKETSTVECNGSADCNKSQHGTTTSSARPESTLPTPSSLDGGLDKSTQSPSLGIEHSTIKPTTKPEDLTNSQSLLYIYLGIGLPVTFLVLGLAGFLLVRVLCRRNKCPKLQKAGKVQDTPLENGVKVPNSKTINIHTNSYTMITAKHLHMSEEGCDTVETYDEVSEPDTYETKPDEEKEELLQQTFGGTCPNDE